MVDIERLARMSCRLSTYRNLELDPQRHVLCVRAVLLSEKYEKALFRDHHEVLRRLHSYVHHLVAINDDRKSRRVTRLKSSELWNLGCLNRSSVRYNKTQKLLSKNIYAFLLFAPVFSVPVVAAAGEAGDEPVGAVATA